MMHKLSLILAAFAIAQIGAVPAAVNPDVSSSAYTPDAISVSGRAVQSTTINQARGVQATTVNQRRGVQATTVNQRRGVQATTVNQRRGVQTATVYGRGVQAEEAHALEVTSSTTFIPDTVTFITDFGVQATSASVPALHPI